RHERFEAGFWYPNNPTPLLADLGMTREKRSSMPVWPKSHQHYVEQRPPGQQPLFTVKATKVRFVKACGFLHGFNACRHCPDVAERGGNTIEQEPSRSAEIAARIAVSDKAVVTPEPMNMIP